MEDDDVLLLLELCDRYASLMTSLSTKMSSGYFSMAVARKAVARKEPRATSLCVDNIRHTLTPNKLAYAHISQPVQSVQSTQYKSYWNIRPKSITITNSSDTNNTNDDNDIILYMCALPPKALRQSQDHFVDSLKDISELTYIANEIKRILDKKG